MSLRNRKTLLNKANYILKVLNGENANLQMGYSNIVIEIPGKVTLDWKEGEDLFKECVKRRISWQLYLNNGCFKFKIFI